MWRRYLISTRSDGKIDLSNLVRYCDLIDAGSLKFIDVTQVIRYVIIQFIFGTFKDVFSLPGYCLKSE